MEDTCRFSALGQALSNEGLPATIRKVYINIEARLCLLDSKGAYGEVERSFVEKTAIRAVLLLEETGARLRQDELGNQILLTFGISTARSSPKFCPSFGPTLTLFA